MSCVTLETLLPDGRKRFMMIGVEPTPHGSGRSSAMTRQHLAWAVPLIASVFIVHPVEAASTLVPTLAAPAKTAKEIALRGAVPVFDAPTSEIDEEWPADMNSTVERIAAQCQTGSLLFSAGDCLAVRAYTGSRFTHVATAVVQEDEIWIYDSMNGSGVRKLLLEEYLEVQAPDEVTLFHPGRPFAEEETRRYRAALERQLGRPYAVKHFVTGKRCEGLHCAEYVTDALIEIDWLRAEHPSHVSPGSLLAGVSQAGAYSAGERVIVPHALKPIPEPASWCGRAWQNTVLCVDGGCVQLSRWFLCR
jgi:hypothetical protein